MKLDEALDLLADSAPDRGTLAEVLLEWSPPIIDGGIWTGEGDIPGLDMELVSLKYGNGPLYYVTIDGQTPILQATDPINGGPITEAAATMHLSAALREAEHAALKASLLEALDTVLEG